MQTAARCGLRNSVCSVLGRSENFKQLGRTELRLGKMNFQKTVKQIKAKRRSNGTENQNILFFWLRPKLLTYFYKQ